VKSIRLQNDQMSHLAYSDIRT